jgi:hypothetical protein
MNHCIKVIKRMTQELRDRDDSVPTIKAAFPGTARKTKKGRWDGG